VRARTQTGESRGSGRQKYLKILDSGLAVIPDLDPGRNDGKENFWTFYENFWTFYEYIMLDMLLFYYTPN